MAIKDDAELERLATNNPAMTIPASESLELSRRLTRKQTKKDKSPPKQQQNGETTFTTSDPAGDIEEVQTKDSNHPDLSKYDKGWRRIVRNFSPSWFSVTMGTGIVSLLLITIPWKAAWLYWLSVIFFCLNVVIFVLAFVISVLRYTLYPEIWVVMINDPTNSLFIATMPMGFTTLVESWIFLVCPYWGYWSVIFAWILWMINSVVAFSVTVGMSWMLMSQSHLQSLDRITAAQLLPIAATIVASGAGAEAAELLRNYNHAIGTLITSYVMWGMATPFAMLVLVIYYQRLAVHKLPPREVIVSSFLPLGPLGMGGYSIMYMGKVAKHILPHVDVLSNTPIAADVLYLFGMFVALIMWGFGCVWFVFALGSLWHARPFPFNMGWWGFTFPLGVYSISTITFGVLMPSMFFRVLGTIFSVMVILLWIVVFIGTVKGAWSGKLFYAPCLKNLKPEDAVPSDVKDVEKAT